ncbi:MAG TPA: TolC family protein [Polyangiales bacterium]|nr:TolC family protein [Polyangiales bacterium]
MITKPQLESRPRQLSLGAGALVLALSSVSPSFTQAQNAPAGAPNDVTAAPAASPRQPAPQDSTRATSETQAATEQMQAELEPTAGGLTSEEAVRLALENSPNLHKSEIEFSKADANKARAKIAFLPRIDASLGFSRLSKINLPPFNLFPNADVNSDAYRELGLGAATGGSPFAPILSQWTLQMRATMPITEIFLTIIPQYKGVKSLAKVAENQRDAQKLQVAFDARNAFWNYAQLRGNVAVARASVRVRESALRDLQSLVQAGTATQTELVRAQGELENAKAVEIQANGGVDVAREQLVQLIGTPVDPNRGIGEPFVNIDIGETPAYDKVLDEARRTRPELLALANTIEARQRLLTSKKGAQYPKLSATFGDTYANPNQRYIPPDPSWHNTWDVGATLAWSPNDTALAYTQAQDAANDLKTAYEDKRLIDQGIAVEAATAVTNHRSAAATITAKTQQLEAARRYEADQRALLLAGAATPNDLLLAQRDLLAASLDWVNAFIAGRVAQAALLKARGQTGLVSSAQ